MSEGIPLDVADVEACSAVEAGSASHQFLEKNIVSESDVEDSMYWELLNVLVQLASGSWETVEDDSFSRFGFFHFFIEDLNYNLVTDKTSRLDDSSDFFNEVFIKVVTNGSFQDFPDLISGGYVIVSEVFPE